MEYDLEASTIYTINALLSEQIIGKELILKKKFDISNNYSITHLSTASFKFLF
jgi:hypothetical protein